MRQILVIFSGLPGTGKTTLAKHLARELFISLLCIDDVTGKVPENPTVQFWDSKVAVLLGLAERQLEMGLSVIVDSVFMNTDRHHAQSLARRYEAQFRPIHTFISDEAVWKERIQKRYEESAHNAADWKQIERQRTHFLNWEPDTALFVDAVAPFEKNHANVLSFVQQNETTMRPLDEVELIKGSYH
ncbi:MAG: hypothetical protein OHK003_10670 [Anaerolineales bacterium]